MGELEKYIPVVGPIVGAASNLIGPGRQFRKSKQLAAFQHSKNMELLKYQLDYNSPAAQMERFKAAGLNPNLMYGQGSSGNMESAPRYPEGPNQHVPNIGEAIAGIMPQYQQARLMASQADVNEQRILDSTVKRDLMNAQKDLVKANPYMKQEYVNSLVTQLQATAEMKANERDFMMTGHTDNVKHMNHGWQMLENQFNLLEQRFNLSRLDAKMKGELITTQEFRNALEKIQVDWMKNGEMTPQHIYQGILMLLQRLMSR